TLTGSINDLTRHTADDSGAAVTGWYRNALSEARCGSDDEAKQRRKGDFAQSHQEFLRKCQWPPACAEDQAAPQMVNGCGSPSSAASGARRFTGSDARPALTTAPGFRERPVLRAV